ncbi:MAG: hypothetical protein DK841_04475 [Candidatus Melainabacteria bacterium]|nr:MAG: hypothetical protein DK841_04475 [Candidatus Melainabacteria bacterium]
MKKLFLMLSIVAVAILVSSKGFADVVTKRPVNRPSTATQHRPNYNNTTQTQRKSTGNKLADNVMMCKPYSESLNSNVGGMNFNFNVRIEGWVNNKCRLNFVARSTGINEIFKSLYGVDASQASIYTFEPKIRCDFTKQQLITVGDSILQEQERNNGATNNMLKNPQDIVIPTSLSASDASLMNVILNERACTILNAGDSNGMFESLFNSF